MNSFRLTRTDTNEPLDLWGCGRCGNIYTSAGVAGNCCYCIECGQPVGDATNDFFGARNYPTHTACRYERDRQIEAARMDVAEKLDAYDGWVYCDGCGSNEGFFPSVDDFAEWWQDEHGDDDLPEFVWTCKPQRIVPPADEIMDSLLTQWMENGWEDMESSDFAGLDELAAAVKAFSEANENVVSYWTDYKRAVRVKP